MATKKQPRKTSRDRPRQPRTTAPLPTVTAEKILENKSRAIFNEAVSPWLVSDWSQHDYGIDAIVELTAPRSTGNHDATGKRFAVQLKSTEEDLPSRETVAVRVGSEKIRYWVESTEPVLVVLCHVPNRRLLWRWADSALVDELNTRDASWIGQETVTINLRTASVMSDDAKREIAAHVVAHRPSARRVLAPGRYAAFHAALTTLAGELSARARPVGFESVIKRLTDLETSIRTSTYVVALTGPARAGKSTLLNALVGRDVSPVGRLPTTAVSLLVTAGANDGAEVVLADDRRIHGEASSAFLDEFATQERNPDNAKRVRLVIVRLVNAKLERGVAYADAPGLHDPSDEIRAITEIALRSAHAIVYVLDISPAKHGGFSLNAHQLDDLKRLRSSAERLFLVLNKADVLSLEEQGEVARYLDQVLSKYGVRDSLPVSPLFTSASSAWAWHQGGRVGPSPVEHLEEEIWKHLLATNSTGVDRLRVAATELRRAGQEFAALLKARRLNGAEAHRLRQALSKCRDTERELVSRCRGQRDLDSRMVALRLREQRDTVLAQLRDLLKAVPAKQSLPTGGDLERHLQAHVIGLLGGLWNSVGDRFKAFARTVSEQVEGSLQQARLATGFADTASFQLPQVPAFNIASDSFQEAWTGLFAGGFFGLLLGGPWAWALAASGWLAGLILGEDRRRQRAIERIMEHAAKSLDAAHTEVHAQVQARIDSYLGALARHVSDRISVFVHDVERQLDTLGTPLSPHDASALEEHEKAVLRAFADAESLFMELDGAAVEKAA